MDNPLVQPDPGLFIWTILTFLVLLALLAKFAWRPLLEALEKRQESIRRSLLAAGFDVELVTEISYQASAESERAWLSIPIFTRDQLSGLPYEQRMRVLDQACEHVGPGQTQPQPWVVFIARPTNPG